MFKSHVLLMQDLGLCISLSFLICCLKWPSNCSPSVIVIGWLSSRHNEVISLCRGCSCTSHCIELFFLAIHIPMFSAGVCHWSWLVLTPILKPKITSNPVHTDQSFDTIPMEHCKPSIAVSFTEEKYLELTFVLRNPLGVILFIFVCIKCL